MISVIIPTYNNGIYLEEAINSVASQLYNNYEIIIVDDGSSDGTRDLIDNINVEVKYIQQQHQGVAVARNTGLKNSKGEYCTFLDADDIWFKENLDIKLNIFNNYPDVDAVFSDFALFDDRGTISERGMREQYPIFWSQKREIESIFTEKEYINYSNKSIPVYRGWLFETLLFGNMINSCSIILTKKSMEETGYFRSELKSQEDYDYWLRYSQKYKLAYVDYPLLGYRKHENQLTNAKNADEIIMFIKEVLETYYRQRNTLMTRSLAMKFKRRYSNIFKILGLAYIRKGNKVGARNALQNSWNINKMNIASIILLAGTYIYTNRVHNVIRNIMNK